MICCWRQFPRRFVRSGVMGLGHDNGLCHTRRKHSRRGKKGAGAHVTMVSSRHASGAQRSTWGKLDWETSFNRCGPRAERRNAFVDFHKAVFNVWRRRIGNIASTVAGCAVWPVVCRPDKAASPQGMFEVGEVMGVVYRTPGGEVNTSKEGKILVESLFELQCMGRK